MIRKVSLKAVALLASTVGMLTSCMTVKEYQKGKLNDGEIQTVHYKEKLTSLFLMWMYFNRCGIFCVSKCMHKCYMHNI